MNRLVAVVLLCLAATHARGEEAAPAASAPEAPPAAAPSAGPLLIDYHQLTGAPRVFDPNRLGHVWFGTMSLTYSDEQANDAGQTDSYKDVSIAAMRLGFEYQHNEKERLTLDVRRFMVDTPAWTERGQALATWGYVLPWMKVLQPEIGVAWGRDVIDWNHRLAPRAGREWQRNFIVGGSFRQPVWEWNTKLAHYAIGRWYSFDPWMLNNNGYEWEVGLGTAAQWGRWRADLVLGYIAEAYSAYDDASAQAAKRVSVDSYHSGTTITGVVWF
jgi:hypothetical protein